ncbi:hypothetical protein BBF96_10020 [Anoxybacter fermentans]|uniref:UbiC transcription regulator-associated domain-containing protein n=1 Tax=Anoxybacter fermentans TaxID=1323375 RepID=A0A3Q9HR45_9FIRM|nr:UTRA domain-containing protein [Anoxybacter fermentans]AZR73688.1 hypothetical protein BBF96_10020 [Anoxybacter fermentans]
MAVGELTKKEQIINFAQSDPFLKISDIAEYVQTTPRYVRTILSEANISLMELRERYARSMEKRLQTQTKSDLKMALKLKPKNSEIEIGDLGIDQLLEEEFEELQKINKEEKLWRISQVCYSGGHPFCIKELITYFSEDLTDKEFKTLDSVYKLFDRKGTNRIQFMENIVRFESPEENIRIRLGLKKYEKAIIITRYILLNRIPIGLENYYLRSDSIEMSFPGELVM